MLHYIALHSAIHILLCQCLLGNIFFLLNTVKYVDVASIPVLYQLMQRNR